MVQVNAETPEDCSEFARTFKALAFNFSPANRSKNNLYAVTQRNETAKGDDDDDEEFFSCELLDCAENRNFSSIINDTRFDYYSLYTHPVRKFHSN